MTIFLAPAFDDVNGCGIRVSDKYLWGVVSLVTIFGFTVKLRDPEFNYVSDYTQYKRYFGDISFGQSQCFNFNCFFRQFLIVLINIFQTAVFLSAEG